MRQAEQKTKAAPDSAVRLELLGRVPDARLQTPILDLDPEVIGRQYRRFVGAFPAGTAVRFATKCNPHPIVIRTLARLGSSFEAASSGELELLGQFGVPAEEVLHSLPCRSQEDVRRAAELGVGRWAIDSIAEAEKVAAYDPGASVNVRLAVDDSASRWRLSRKFGADAETAVALIHYSAELGLCPDAISFHVGSQVTDVNAWAKAIDAVGAVLGLVPESIRPTVVNVGGGYPVAYATPVPQIEEIGQSVTAAIDRLDFPVALEAEPGRVLVAEAGTVTTEVTGLSTRSGRRWAFLDVGAFNGLSEASPGGGALDYPVSAKRRRKVRSNTATTLAGPTCDGADTIGDSVMLPADLAVGEHLEISCAGAYSNAYASGFCGAKPLSIRALQSNESPTLHVGGTDLYRVAWPGSDLFQRAVDLEEQWFDLSGFTEQDGLQSYAPYDAASTFIVVQDGEGHLVSVCRLISASGQGFKTINDFELSIEGQIAFDSIPDRRIVEVGTMATHPAARGMGPTLEVMRGVLDCARRRQISHFLTSLDAGLFDVFTGPPLYMPCAPIGEPKEYFGSLTVPGFGAMAEHERLLALHSPEFHAFLYGNSQVNPVAR